MNISDFKNWLKTVAHCQLKIIVANWTQNEQIKVRHSHTVAQNSHANQA